ncbi:hypothetical protein OBBRIDRAFT_482989 [Obba rivulosa]|uniref:Uncharacterized protein n=1 Tax=Obba rivulosa TaxID=1052685 RepID=A0A8E2AKW5_9APHY|nr:hypothetical protein OBBRIDRAFT_482989 [Obba rivulosa]
MHAPQCALYAERALASRLVRPDQSTLSSHRRPVRRVRTEFKIIIIVSSVASRLPASHTLAACPRSQCSPASLNRALSCALYVRAHHALSPHVLPRPLSTRPPWCFPPSWFSHRESASRLSLGALPDFINAIPPRARRCSSSYALRDRFLTGPSCFPTDESKSNFPSSLGHDANRHLLQDPFTPDMYSLVHLRDAWMPVMATVSAQSHHIPIQWMSPRRFPRRA